MEKTYGARNLSADFLLVLVKASSKYDFFVFVCFPLAPKKDGIKKQNRIRLCYITADPSEELA